MREIYPVIAAAQASSDNEVQPLPPVLRLRLERAFGTGLAAVRLRTGTDADRLARVLGADAFTFGPAIYFRDGACQPGTAAGQWLIAHEAAHVIQQAVGIASGASEAECERQADRAADLALAGGTWQAPARMARARRSRPAPLIQRHSSYEHRLLGDSPTSDLVAISTGAPNRRAILDNQIQLSALWKDHPDQVTPEQIQKLCPWIKTLRIGPDQVLATYGELNALPDYLSDAVAFDVLGTDILLPVLQVIRQENYNQLTLLATGRPSLHILEGQGHVVDEARESEVGQQVNAACGSEAPGPQQRRGCHRCLSPSLQDHEGSQGSYAGRDAGRYDRRTPAGIGRIDQGESYQEQAEGAERHPGHVERARRALPGLGDADQGDGNAKRPDRDIDPEDR